MQARRVRCISMHFCTGQMVFCLLLVIGQKFSHIVCFYLTAFLTCICLGGEVTLQPSEYAPAILNAGTYLKAPPWNILPGLFLIPCMACGIALLQMLLTFFMRPIFSYILSCVLLLSSAYFASPFLPGNYLMFFRTEIFSENGLSIFLGFCTAFFMIVLSCVIGCLRIEQMDILEKE